MGLERISSILQDKSSNYDIDLFVPILDAAAARAGVEYGKDREIDFSLRVIADHARAFCFLTADGVVPANDKRGYVLRRLLRRAIRHGRKLGIEEPFLHEVTPVVVEGLGDHYPELLAAQEAVLEIGRLEERRFADTLSTGLQLLEESLGGIAADAGERPVLAGKDLFLLYDTFGFPLDLARDIAEERGIELDEAGFEAEMAKQRARAQASWKKPETEEVAGAYAELARTNHSEFAGYGVDRLDGTRVLALLREGRPVEALSEGAEGEVVLEADSVLRRGRRTGGGYRVSRRPLGSCRGCGRATACRGPDRSSRPSRVGGADGGRGGHGRDRRAATRGDAPQSHRHPPSARRAARGRRHARETGGLPRRPRSFAIRFHSLFGAAGPHAGRHRAAGQPQGSRGSSRRDAGNRPR